MVVRIQRYPAITSPFESISTFEQEIDQLFGGFLGTGAVSRQYPALDVAEYEGESVIVAELPGVRREDVKISVQDGTLTISGVRKETATPEKSTWLRNESHAGEFSRTVQLPHEVDLNAVGAELTNGVLRIVLPKAATALPREIRVK